MAKPWPKHDDQCGEDIATKQPDEIADVLKGTQQCLTYGNQGLRYKMALRQGRSVAHGNDLLEQHALGLRAEQVGRNGIIPAPDQRAQPDRIEPLYAGDIPAPGLGRAEFALQAGAAGLQPLKCPLAFEASRAVFDMPSWLAPGNVGHRSPRRH